MVTDLSALEGERVRVYRNLRTGSFSVMQRGRVVAHTYALCLSDVSFTVQEAGWKRARAKQSRNVHAFVDGQVTALGEEAWMMSFYKMLLHNMVHPFAHHVEVTYDPFGSEPMFHARLPTTQCYIGKRWRFSTARLLGGKSVWLSGEELRIALDVWSDD